MDENKKQELDKNNETYELIPEIKAMLADKEPPLRRLTPEEWNERSRKIKVIIEATRNFPKPSHEEAKEFIRRINERMGEDDEE